MKYLVSVENTSYFYWQLELLIESFAMLGLEDSLVIALADNDSQKVGGFSANLVKHKNKFLHPNEGRKSGYLPLNRIGAIRYALAYETIDFPFTLIHSDMILNKPVEAPDGETPEVLLNNLDSYPSSEEELIKGEIKTDLEKIAEQREVDFERLPNLPFFSAPAVFNSPFKSIADVFFSRVETNMVEIFGRKGADFPCERAAWELTLGESFQHCSVSGRFMAAPMLFESEPTNFVHYKMGIPPVFHKKFFRYEDGVYLTGQGPYETLMEHNTTLSMNHMQKVIRSYIKSRSSPVRIPRERQTSHADAHD
jgi:hypothetical protein